MLRYPAAWQHFQLRNTISTSKLKNMKFMVYHFWGEKRPTKTNEYRIPTMFRPASQLLPTTGNVKFHETNIVVTGGTGCYHYRYKLCLIVIKSEVWTWTIIHCLGLGHETMVHIVFLYIVIIILSVPSVTTKLALWWLGFQCLFC